MKSNAGRFDGRAEKFVQFRPSYPVEAIDTLVAGCGLDRGAKVADIGSGTGIFSQLLVDREFASASHGIVTCSIV